MKNASASVWLRTIAAHYALFLGTAAGAAALYKVLKPAAVDDSSFSSSNASTSATASCPSSPGPRGAVTPVVLSPARVAKGEDSPLPASPVRGAASASADIDADADIEVDAAASVAAAAAQRKKEMQQRVLRFWGVVALGFHASDLGGGAGKTLALTSTAIAAISAGNLMDKKVGA
jgi:hypothetical protein